MTLLKHSKDYKIQLCKRLQKVRPRLTGIGTESKSVFSVWPISKYGDRLNLDSKCTLIIQ